MVVAVVGVFGCTVEGYSGGCEPGCTEKAPKTRLHPSHNHEQLYFIGTGEGREPVRLQSERDLRE